MYFKLPVPSLGLVALCATVRALEWLFWLSSSASGSAQERSCRKEKINSLIFLLNPTSFSYSRLSEPAIDTKHQIAIDFSLQG